MQPVREYEAPTLMALVQQPAAPRVDLKPQYPVPQVRGRPGGLGGWV